MAAVTIHSDFGAQETKVSLFPLFLYTWSGNFLEKKKKTWEAIIFILESLGRRASSLACWPWAQHTVKSRHDSACWCSTGQLLSQLKLTGIPWVWVGQGWCPNHLVTVDQRHLYLWEGKWDLVKVRMNEVWLYNPPPALHHSSHIPTLPLPQKEQNPGGHWHQWDQRINSRAVKSILFFFFSIPLFFNFFFFFGWVVWHMGS